MELLSGTPRLNGYITACRRERESISIKMELTMMQGRMMQTAVGRSRGDGCGDGRPCVTMLGTPL